MSDTNSLVDKLNEMAVYWSGDDYDTCREAAEKIESMQDDIERLTNVLVEAEARADKLQKRAEAFQAAYESGVEKRTELVKVIDALKSGDPDYYVYSVLDGCDLVNEAIVEYKASKTQVKSFLGYTILSEEKVYLCSKPTQKPLTSEEIEKILIEIPDWDDHEYSLSFARAIETKVRSQYEI